MKKLVLTKETVRVLQDADLSAVVGGIGVIGIEQNGGVELEGHPVHISVEVCIGPGPGPHPVTIGSSCSCPTYGMG